MYHFLTVTRVLEIVLYCTYDYNNGLVPDFHDNMKLNRIRIEFKYVISFLDL
jgi:hypothetical protein